MMEMGQTDQVKENGATHASVFGKNPEHTGLVKMITAKTAIEMEGKLRTTWAEIKN